MKTLAIETSGKRGSIALLDAGNLVASQSLDTIARSAQTLAKSMDETLKRHQWRPTQIGLIVVAQGPGSFTGLRVGVTTAKTFAYAAKTELVGVDTLQAIAASLPKDEPPIWSVMDAGRQQLFAARFKQQGESLICVEPTKILAIDQWLAGLNKADQVAGPALESLKNRLPEHVELTDQRCWQPQAQWVGRLGWQHYLDGQRTDCWEMVPEYFRKSAAEENTEKARSSAEPS